MENVLNYLNMYLQHHPYIGLFIVFLIAFAESLPLIGTIVPGSITMTMVGILVGRNIMPGFETLAFATCGAFCGDILGFWSGKYFKEGIQRCWPFNKNPKWLVWGENFFGKHGGKSIILGRFFGPARSTIPLIAGLMNLSWPRFVAAAIPSSLFWSALYLTPGVLIGFVSLELPKGKTTTFMLIGAAIIICLWIFFWGMQRFFNFTLIKINQVIDQFWQWLNDHHASKPIVQWLKSQTHPKDHYQLTLAILSLFSLLLFFVMLISVITHGFLTYLNEPLFHFLQNLRTAGADKFFSLVTFLGEKSVLSFSCVIVLILLAIHKRWRAASHLIVLFLVSIAAIHFIKEVVPSSRPHGFLVINSSHSFPSGHGLLSLVFFSFVAFLVRDTLAPVIRTYVGLLLALLITMIAFSRLYLGAHWLTDIVGAWLLGFSLLLITIVSYRRKSASFIFTRLDLIGIIIAIIIPWLVYGVLSFKQVLQHQMQVWPKHHVSLEEWWNKPPDLIPIYRPNRFGKPIAPFNIQWVGSLKSIKDGLITHGWEVVETQPRVKTAINRIANYKKDYYLPVFPQLYQEKPPALFMIKNLAQKKILELHLWASNLIFSDSPLPLWIGTLNLHEQPKHFSLSKKRQQNLLIYSTESKEFSLDFQQQPNWQWRVAKVPNRSANLVKYLQWDGEVLLIKSK